MKKFVAAILAILGIQAWERDTDGHNTLTVEQQEKLKNFGFSDTFLSAFKKELERDFATEGATQDGARDRAAVLQGLLADYTNRLAQANEQLEQLRASGNTAAAALEKKNLEIARLTEQVRILGSQEEHDPGAGASHTTSAAASQQPNLDDEQQLCGWPGEMYSLDRPYNVRARAALLERNGQQVIAVPAASSIDYTQLKADLGAFYRIPWQERLQSFLMKLPSLESLFPVESGYQDLATLTNIWLGEFSQSDNTESDFDNVVKGKYEFGTETLRMYSVMFAHKFKNLKELERSWIGYLNREGSDVMKWSFIEYILAETSKKLHNEREQRRINGVRKNPALNTPGRALAAADGLYEFIRKKVDGHIDFTPDGGTTGRKVYQIKPFELGEITMANIGEKIWQGTEKIPAVIRESGSLVLYMPAYMVIWYHKYNELHYGENRDYKANIMYVKEYPMVKIIAVPNADNHQRLIWTMEGNIHLYEHVAGEMYRFNIEQQDWTLKVWSNWKESIWAVAVGYKYERKSDMGYDRQMIFCNERDLPDTYFVQAAPDTNPDATEHTSIETSANTAQTFAITDITNAEVGVPITLKCGSTEYGVSIAASGKFSLLANAWTPGVGDTITLMKRSDGKFFEIARTTVSDDIEAFDANDTTPSVDGGTEFVIGANTQATAITALDDSVAGTTYTIHGAGSTYASTIANSGNFVLTAAMTLSEGHSITVIKVGTKFYEISRT